MKYGEVAKRKLPTNHVDAIKEMISELLDRTTPNFNTTTFIVHEIDGYLTVGMKWEGK